MGVQCGPGQEQRTLLSKIARVKRFDLAARYAEMDHHSAWFEAIETVQKGCLADGIVHHVHALATSEPLYFGYPVLLIVEEGFRRASFAGQGCFCGGSPCA